MNVMILGIRRKGTADEQKEPPIQHTGCGVEPTPKRFDAPVVTNLGMELVDIVNVLRGLGTPEYKIQKAALTRVSVR